MPETATSTRPAGRMVALQPGMFRMPDRLDIPIHLLGSRCRACGETFFPKRVFCANCSSDDMHEVELPDHGVISTYTIVRQQLPGSAMTPPYAIVRVALKGGVTVQTVMTDGDLARIGIGDLVELIAHRIMDDEAGNPVVSFVARLATGTPAS